MSAGIFIVVFLISSRKIPILPETKIRPSSGSISLPFRYSTPYALSLTLRYDPDIRRRARYFIHLRSVKLCISVRFIYTSVFQPRFCEKIWKNKRKFWNTTNSSNCPSNYRGYFFFRAIGSIGVISAHYHLPLSFVYLF
jgi:hypothetical protein